MTWLQPSSGELYMTKPITSRGLVTLWLEALATTPKVYLHLAGKFSRHPPPFSFATHGQRAHDDSKSMSKKETVGGHHMRHLAWLSCNFLSRSSPPHSCRCNLKHQMWRTRQATPNEIRRTSSTACLAPLGCSCGRGGGQIRQSEGQCGQEIFIGPHGAMRCHGIRFGLLDIKRQLHSAQCALSQISAGCTRFVYQLATPLAAPRT